MTARRRARARIEGTVQGVGFRPYVFTLSEDLGLAGFVRNDERGVVLEVEGAAPAVEGFLRRLPVEAPPLAAVEAVRLEELVPTGERGFAIAPSTVAGSPDAPVSPDTATCDACLAELFDPADRRFRYPFINCTNCGPRWTIVRGVPYDRPRTTMAGFVMCDACRAEYEDPRNRRFHAQPNACPECGPRARLVGPGGEEVEGIAGDIGAPGRGAAGDAAGASKAGVQDRAVAAAGAPKAGVPGDAVAAAARALIAGRIVAVKGVGGYHLACRADDDAAVAALRARKHREDRPFALMAPDVEAARALVELEPEAEALLRSRARPVVLAPRRACARIASGVAPGVRELGVMLPYSPLHHLLLADAGITLVMTSGNVSDEPIAFRDADALERLGGLADLLLLHDRPIETRTDDSVVRVVRRRPLLVRRSRGHVPAAMGLPVPAERAVLGCGAELKSTFCLARGGRAWVGHHIGDLTNPETLRSFEEGIAHVARLFAVQPEVVAHDLHPDYLSTAYAVAREPAALVGVQHHHAHLAACLAEHGERGPAVGAIFDGTGFGPDGTVWGGELLAGDLAGFRRAGHLLPVRMPGGEAAVRQPWRMACAWLTAAREDGEAGPVHRGLAPVVDAARWSAVASLARTGLGSPWTTSAGRLCDAVAALCGLRAEVRYEGQAAIELEACVDDVERGAYPLLVTEAARPGPIVEDAHRAADARRADGGDPSTVLLDPRETILAVAADIAAGVAPSIVAARFHAALARATAEACSVVARREGLDTVVLSGGVFQNRRLLEGVAAELEARGLRVLVPERLPPNDGGIAYGQVAVAAGGRAGCRRAPRRSSFSAGSARPRPGAASGRAGPRPTGAPARRRAQRR